jgi:biotin carboxylase
MPRLQKKLMILGAGYSQLPAIRKAVELGYYVITVDYLPENVGHRLSHHYVNCSTVDREAVLKAARELNIEGIMTSASDVATPTVGYVAEQLGLPGYRALVAETLSNKGKFRVFQQEHRLNSPKFLTGQCLQGIEEQLTTLSLPIMFKPVDSSGSRGITRVDEFDHDRCLAAFEYAHNYSRSGMVCAEEFVAGTDVSGDGFLVNGRPYVVITHKHKRRYVPTGHSLPTNISSEDQERVVAEVAAHCSAVGYTDGPLDFDVRASPERVTVLEMSPRLGGNGIPAIIERGTGVDLIAATVRFALGEEVAFPKNPEIVRSCGSWVFGSDHAGLLAGVATQEELQASVPEVFEYFSDYRVGDTVPEFVHSANRLGYALFDCLPGSSYGEIVDRIQSALQLTVVS